MASHTGTAKGFEVWYRQQRWGDGATVELHALAMEGPQCVATWSVEDMRAQGIGEWAQSVDDLASSDASARDVTTRYELRHVGGDGRTRGTSNLRRVVVRDEDATGKPTGDLMSINVQLQKSLERANGQVIEAARVATQVAQASADAQRQSMVLLGQAYALIGALQTTNVEMHADRIESQPPTKRTAGDEAFAALVQHVAPIAVATFMESMDDSASPKKEH